MEVKKGYKWTEVGVVPEEWEVKLVEELAEVKSGKRLPFGKYLVPNETPYPYIRVADMFSGGVNLENIMYVPEDAASPIKNYKIFVDDIFISVAGTLGLVGKIPPQLNGANLTENADRLTNISCNSDYLLYIMMSALIQSKIESERTLGAQPKLALARIRKFQIPLPPTQSEQTAIATALTDMDKLISALEGLLAKKRAIKQGAMGELLKRKEGWEVKRLGEVGSFKKGKGIRKDEVVPFGLPCVRYGELYTHHNDYIKNFNSFISPESAKESQKIVEGDLLFAGSGETATDIGKCAAFLDDFEAYAGGDVIIFSPIGCNSKFLAFLMNSQAVIKQKSQLSQGDAVVHIYPKNLATIEICLPSLEEQTAIGNILSDMDAEIDSLTQTLTKYRQLKQGMMGELLTGKTRLL